MVANGLNKLLSKLMGRSKVVAWFCSVEKVFCDIFQNSKGNTFAGVSFFNKGAYKARNFIKKETPAQMLSFEF